MGGIRNFQVCSRCRNHSIRNVLKGHKKTCPFKLCGCEKCLVTKDRQNFIAKEIAMHRYEVKNKSDSEDYFDRSLKLNLVRSKSAEDKASGSSEIWSSKRSFNRRKSNCEIRRDQMCSRCRNHGIIQLLRGHKNACLFVDCICEKCEITKKRREIMAKQIKDYRNFRSSDFQISSPEITFHSSETVLEEVVQAQFVDYEPIQSRDMFFMVQSLFEKYAMQSVDKKIQLIHAFAKMAKGDWNAIEKALETGEIYYNLCC